MHVVAAFAEKRIAVLVVQTKHGLDANLIPLHINGLKQNLEHWFHNV